jgi:hypothetical protein
LTAAVLLAALPAVAAAECETELEAFDRQVAAATELSAFQRQTLQGVRQTAAAMCARGQAALGKQMLNSVIEELPGAAAPAETGGPAEPSPGTWLERPDTMFQFWFQDMDYLDGRLRVLYSTSPSLEQGQSGDWTVNVYVVEVPAAGEPVQHRLYSEQAMEHAAMALRPGEEQVLVQRNAGGAKHLDVWSVPGGETLSSTEISFPRGPNGENWDWGQFRGTTTDGNIGFVTTQFEGRRSGNPVSTSAWFELTPAGGIVGQGSHVVAGARQQITSWFPAHSGGTGLALDITALGTGGLEDAGEGSFTHEIGSRRIEAVVHREKRLLITDADSKRMSLSPAMERDLMWSGEMSIPSELPSAERLAQNRQQMQLMEKTEIAAGGRRHAEVVRPTANGYGALVRVVANRKLEPPVHGRYFVELSPDAVEREVYLEPIADKTDVKFVDFAGGGNGDVYLLAEGDRREAAMNAHILRLAGNPEARAIADFHLPDAVQLDGMLAADGDAWLAGHGFNDELGKVSLWIQRIGPADFRGLNAR